MEIVCGYSCYQLNYDDDDDDDDDDDNNNNIFFIFITRLGLHFYCCSYIHYETLPNNSFYTNIMTLLLILVSCNINLVY